jgi:hypothetical protein
MEYISFIELMQQVSKIDNVEALTVFIKPADFDTTKIDRPVEHRKLILNLTNLIFNQ